MSEGLRQPFNGRAQDESAQENSPQNAIVPTVIRDNERGRIAYDVYSRLLDSNIIFLTHQVEPMMANTVVAQMFHLYYDKIKPALDAARDPATGETDLSKVPEEKRKIKMFINSPGGYVNDGLQIYDAMQLMKSEGVIIETHATGIAMSMGSILLVAGSDGHRYAWPSANIMLHQLSGGTQGKAIDMNISNEESQYLNERLKDIYRVHTKLTDPQIETIFSHDYFMRAEEARQLGVIDNIQYPHNDPKVKEMLERQNRRHMEGEEVVQKVKKTRVMREVPANNN